MNTALRLPILALALLSCSLLPVVAQPEGRDITNADEGTEFRFGFIQHEERSSFCSDSIPTVTTQRVVVTARSEGAEVVVEVPGDSVISLSIPAQQTRLLEFDGDDFLCIGEGVCTATFRVRSDVPVQVQIGSFASHTADMTVVPPIARWGMSYLSMNYPTDWYDLPPNPLPFDSCSLAPRHGEVGIVATEDNTLVQIVPTVDTRGGLAKGRPHTQILMAGEMWQVQDRGELRGVDDLSGTRITADKPIGVMTGHMRTGLPSARQTKDMLFDALPTTAEAGLRYHAAPFFSGENELLRIMAVAEGPIVVATWSDPGLRLDTLDRSGTFVDIEIDRPVRIDATDSIQVGQYTASSVPETEVGDPALVMLDPSDAFRTGVTFRPTELRELGGLPERQSHFGTVILRGAFDSTLRLDGRPLLGSSNLVQAQQIPGPSSDTTLYTWVRIDLGVNPVEQTLLGSQPMLAYVAGGTEFAAYAARAAGPVVIVDSLPPSVDIRPGCPAVSATITVEDVGTKVSGIASVDFDTASINMVYEPRAGQVGDGRMTGRLRLVDPRRSGTGILRSVDLSGNERVDTVELGPSTDSVLQPDRVEEIGGPGNTIRQIRVVFRNRGSFSLSVDSATFFEEGLRLATPLRALVPAGGEVTFVIDADLRNGSIIDTMLIWVGCRWYILPISVEYTPSNVRIGPIDFGEVPIGDTVYRQLSMTNITGETIVYDSVEFATLISWFRLQDPSQLPIEIGPGATEELSICFAPEHRLEYRGTMTILNSVTDAVASTELRGTGVDSVSGVDDNRTGVAGSTHITRIGNELHIRLSGPRHLASLELYSITGERIHREILGRSSTDFVVAIPELVAGVYYAVIEGRNGVERVVVGR